MNVLFTCAGRRSFAIRAFKQALNNCGRVFACDASSEAPALQIADKSFVVPSADADNYLDVLLTLPGSSACASIPAVNRSCRCSPRIARFFEIGTLPLVSCRNRDLLRQARPRHFSTAAVCGAADLCSARTCAGNYFARRDNTARDQTALKSARSGLRWSRTNKNSTSLLRQRRSTSPVRFRSGQRRHSGRLRFGQERLSGEEYGLDIVNDLNGRYVCFAKRKSNCQPTAP
jgi:carbamoyl-phosphate synthase large subunit